MAHILRFLVTVELERTEGKFASRDEMAEALIEAIESADPSTIDGLGVDGMTTYEVINWMVEER